MKIAGHQTKHCDYLNAPKNCSSLLNGIGHTGDDRVYIGLSCGENKRHDKFIITKTTINFDNFELTNTK